MMRKKGKKNVLMGDVQKKKRKMKENVQRREKKEVGAG